MKMLRSLMAFSAALAASACSNLLISKGASADGSSILAYTADDMSLFGSLDLRPAADHAPGALRDIWDCAFGAQPNQQRVPKAAP